MVGLGGAVPDVRGFLDDGRLGVCHPLPVARWHSGLLLFRVSAATWGLARYPRFVRVEITLLYLCFPLATGQPRSWSRGDAVATGLECI